MRRFWDLWRWRHLAAHLAWRDSVARWRRSLLGPLWLLVNPLVQVLAYTLVFSVVLRQPVEDYPVWLMAGLLPWLWFAGALQLGATALQRDAALVRKSPLAPEVLPLRWIAVTGVDWAVGMSLLVVVLAARGRPPTVEGFGLLLLLGALQALATAGLALPVALVGAACRDTDHALQNVLRVAFLATPVAWTLHVAPEAWRPWLQANPAAWFVEAYRSALLGGPPPGGLGIAALLCVAAAALGLAAFGARASRVAEVL